MRTMPDSVEQARHWYAEELRHTAKVNSSAVIDAFAAVPRERFVGPGPWRIKSPMDLAEYWSTENADPRHVYHDVLIALDEARGVNNGQPSPGTEAQLTTLYLLSQARGHGLGSEALALARAEVSRQAAGALGVCVLAANKAGRRFYERWGARRIGERVAFCLDDQPIMDILYRFADL